MARDAVEVLRRWEQQGGVWRVIGRFGATVTVSLMPCTAGEEVDRLTVTDPAFNDWLAANGSSSAMQ